jgi:rubredoxin
MAAGDVQRFEGTYLGDASRLDPHARLECKVCWYVYDPARGDEHWRIPQGTAFSELPPHWTCPNCACEKEQFMVVDG